MWDSAFRKSCRCLVTVVMLAKVMYSYLNILKAHLHPKAQSELADVLIDVVKNRNVQIILESHSEHLLHRLTRRIAEEKLFAEDVALFFCQINEGKSKAEKLSMDKYGNISNWPQNFFGDEMGDLAAKARAEIKRKKANKQ